MNERIKELIAECQEYRPGFDGQEDWYTVFNKQKFAELIVRECAHIAEVNQAENMGWNIGEIIKEHFGVEQ
jgi:hypothetical protein